MENKIKSNIPYNEKLQNKHMSTVFYSIIYALGLLIFLILEDRFQISVIDEIIILFLCLFATLIILLRSKIDRIIAQFLLVVSVYFFITVGVQYISGRQMGVHTIFGFWELWRAHIAIVLGLLISRFVKNKRTLFLAIVMVLQANAIFSILQVIIGPSLTNEILGHRIEYRSGLIRTYGFFGHPNTNAFFLSLLIFIMTATKTQIRKQYFWLIIGFFALLTTGSRQNILPAIIIVIGIFYMKNTRQLLVKNAILGIMITVSFIFVALFSLMDKKSTAYTYSLIPSIDVLLSINPDSIGDSYFRTYALQKGWSRFTTSPFWGVGFGAYGTPASFRARSEYLLEDGFGPVMGKFTQLDLLIPLLLPESGMIGLLIWSISLWWLLKILRKRISNNDNWIFIISWMLVLILAGFVGPGLTHPIVIVFLFLLVTISSPGYDTNNSNIGEKTPCQI